jgi:hypothetical protein
MDLLREKENVLISLIRIGSSRFEALTDRIEVLEDYHKDEIRIERSDEHEVAV